MGKDRLSDLPDGVLLHILSFLPSTWYCFRASVLSKRWKNLWASLPHLFLHSWETMDDSSFKQFVLDVLAKRDNLPITKLAFDYGWQDKSILNRIIEYAVSHDVQHFSVCLQKGLASLSLLLPLFNSCQSLKSLELKHISDLHLLKDLTLPSLINLYISDCGFRVYSGKSIDLFAGLCNLKSLQLSNCNLNEVREGTFKISAPQLDTLTITIKAAYVYCKVEIVAPKLRFFSIGCKSHWVKFSNILDFTQLEVADISMPCLLGMFRDDLRKMFCWLYNAWSLVLSSNIIEWLVRFPYSLEDDASPFVRLKTLKVKYPVCSESTFSIPGRVMNYFGENVIVETIEG